MSTSIPTSTLEKFTTFGDCLRFLRRRAGITQLELSIAVGYSDAQISRLEQNLRLPDIPTIEARFVPALDIEDEPKAVARLLELAANVRREDAPGLGICPYKGLNYFDETDADLFVGRETLTAKLSDRVLSLVSSDDPGKVRFLAIVGASGSGKSSLARAGVVPALRWNKTSASWPIYVFTPTAHPLESLAVSLTQTISSVTATAALMDDLKRDSRSLNLFIKRLLKIAGASHLLLVVDQFEELFALCRSEEERSAFISNLLTAATEADSPAVAVITLRADFYAWCAGYPELRGALASQQEYIGAMSADEMRRAIEEPARRGRWEFEPGLVDLLLHDVGADAGHPAEPGALPLLSHALLETWQRRRGRTLTLSGYASSGGVRGAIAETAEAVFVDQFTHEQQAIARRIFLRLTELGDETATGDTRRRANFSELILKPEEAEATRIVLKALADARLITTSQDSAEVAHEALIREWPTLRAWLEDNREGLRLHRHLTETAQEWLASGRGPDGLYRGSRLVQAREWAAAHAEEMNELESEFLTASAAFGEREAAEREAQRQRELEAAQKLAEAEKQRAEMESQRAEEQASAARQLRKRAVYLAGALIIALGMAFVALFFGAQARQAAISAQNQQRLAFSRELAAAAISNLEVDPERSILLALQAVTVTYSVDKSWTAEAEDALHRALQDARVELTLRGHSNLVASIAFSPDGTRLATASDDGTAKVWDAATGQVLLTIPTTATLGHHGMDFSPDGARLATASDNGTAKVWDANTGEELLTLLGHMDWVSSVAFSPDGKRIATSSEDRTAKVWDAVTGQELLTLPGHAGAVWSVAFSPDGSRLATAGQDARVNLWDSVTGDKLQTFAGHTELINGVAYSPDGYRLATASDDGTAKLWDVVTGKEVLALRGHTSWVASVAFSPDGKRLATTSADGKAKVWDAFTGQELLTLSGHSGPVFGVAFSPECVRVSQDIPAQCGTRLATTSFDGMVKVWNVSFSRELSTILIPNHRSRDLSPDGTRLAAGFEDGSIKLWDISGALFGEAVTGKEPLSLRGHSKQVSKIAFSPDGTRLASSSEDGTARIWDVATGKELRILRGHTGSVFSVAFNPDGTRLATTSADFTVKVWDLTGANDQALLTLPNPTYSYDAAFSPDGALLVVSGTDGTARVWDVATSKELVTLRGHTGVIESVSLSPDGTRVSTGSGDGTAKVWDAATGQDLLTVRGHTDIVMSVAFSSDGSRLATGSGDGTAKIWDAITGRELLTLRGHSAPLEEVKFSPECTLSLQIPADRCGTILLTASGDGTVRFYLLRIEDLVALAHSRLTRSLTLGECQQYLHQDRCPGEAVELAQDPTADATLNRVSEHPSTANGKVCEVTGTTGINDQFFNQLAYQGVQEAAEKFGWEIAVRESQQSEGYFDVMNEVLQWNCDLIVTPTEVGISGVTKTVAEANPDQKFLLMDITYDPPLKNLMTEVYATDQAAFLAGYIAASVTKTGKVGTFGGVYIPAVASFMHGFALGVDYYNQKNGMHVEVLGWDMTKQDGEFIGNFSSPDDGHRMAVKLMDEGSDILLPVAGGAGLGAAAAAQERGGVYIIGVDSDWTATYPEYEGIVLTSILKRVDVSAESAVEAVVNGTFTGGIHVGTLENNGVGLAPFHNLDSLVSPEVKADLEQIKKDIIAGKIKTGL